MSKWINPVPFILAAALLPVAFAQTSTVRTEYHVREVVSGAVYLDGGSNDGLTEGMRFKITRLSPGDPQTKRRDLADATVIAVAENSAVCEVKAPAEPLKVGDTAYLNEEDVATIDALRASKNVRKFPQVVSFTEGDPIEEELREYIPKPPSPEINRVRGRIGFEQTIISDHAAGLQTLQEGVVIRADITRIGGTYWNFTGYWRGMMSSLNGSAATQTLNDLINRTYQIGFTYNNPSSRYVAGFGRYLLPWATSLSTLDGGYVGRRFGKDVVVGMFAGSTPDPTAWNFDPNRQMVGSFVSYSRGSFEGKKWITTAGAAVTRSHWRPERQFLFFENTLAFNTKFSVYSDLEVDRLAKALVSDGNNSPRLARSFLTVRYQPIRKLSFDLSHNYFRDVPTFDLRLIGTGLLDQYLFQGLSGGFRLELPLHAGVYASLGSNKTSQDTRSALNYMGGVVLPLFRFIPIRTDLRYSRFNSSFGAGDYETITFTRQLGDRLHIDFQGGEQHIKSSFSSQSHATYVNSDLDYLLGRHYIFGFGWTMYRGNVQDYDQIFVNLGYRL
jgi:hypothetical protein